MDFLLLGSLIDWQSYYLVKRIWGAKKSVQTKDNNAYS